MPDDGEDKEQRIDLERLSVKPDSITIQLTVERLREECSLRRGRSFVSLSNSRWYHYPAVGLSLYTRHFAIASSWRCFLPRS